MSVESAAENESSPAPRRRLRRPVKVLLACAGVCLLWLLVHVAATIWVGLNDDTRSADVAVALGSKVEATGVPSRWLQVRLDRARRLYEDGLVKHIIVSGGYGAEGFEEADVMRDALVEAGVPAGAIIVDRQGYNTFMTARNTRRIMDERGFETVIVVSHYYHIARIRLAFRRFGVRGVYSAHARAAPELREPRNLVREFVAYYYYLLRSCDEPEEAQAQ